MHTGLTDKISRHIDCRLVCGLFILFIVDPLHHTGCIGVSLIGRLFFRRSISSLALVVVRARDVRVL
jgi:hypothetical protein